MKIHHSMSTVLILWMDGMIKSIYEQFMSEEAGLVVVVFSLHHVTLCIYTLWLDCSQCTVHTVLISTSLTTSM